MDKKKYHFIGIGGIGMSALANILLDKKQLVFGSDPSNNKRIQKLIEKGAIIHNDHLEDSITCDKTVVYSTAIKKDNIEYKTAIERNCSLLHRSELLSDLMHDKISLVIAGSHGKTTTSALLATVLMQANLKPSFAIGGILNSLQTNGLYGEGDYFVVEADESDSSFLNYDSKAAIITNIDAEHMDYYKTEEELLQAFNKFSKKVKKKEHIFWCAEDAYLNKLNLPGISYGFDMNVKLRGSNFRYRKDSIVLDVDFRGVHYRDIKVALSGRHNALNALAVFGLSIVLGIEENIIKKAFASFGGVSRRCTHKGEVCDITIIDDYAHHPTAMATTLQGIKMSYKNRRLVVVFQPHRYTRTKHCLEEFKFAFDCANALFITDIYNAGEEPIDGITPKSILKQIKHSKSSFFYDYVPRDDLINEISAFLRPGDVVVTMGAGDITNLSDELVDKLAEKIAYFSKATSCHLAPISKMPFKH